MERRSESEAVYEAAGLLDNTFIQRKDMFASQLEDGRYVAVKEPVTQRHLVRHLQGQITIGTYLLREDSTTNLAILDADTDEAFLNLLKVARSMHDEGVTSYPELSRRGGHLWFFIEKPEAGEKAKAFGKGIIESFSLGKIESFPKQGSSLEGPGSCIRMPFGFHRITKRRYPFIHTDGTPLAPTVREQIEILSNAQTVTDQAFTYYASLAPVETIRKARQTNGEAKWDKIKDKVRAIDFIGAFVPLRKTSSGAIGNCPFHEDTHASFGVNAKGNYWKCFADCGGGSVIDFWMRYRNLNFPEAVDELANLLGIEE